MLYASGLLPATPPEARGYIGERFEACVGLQYLNARYYDPKLGFGGKTLSHSVFYSPSLLQPDWFKVPAAGVGTNRYAYAGGDYR